MLTLSIMIVMVMLLASVISIGIRMFLWARPVLVLPAVICAGGTVWWVQPHLAADRNRRTAVRRWI